MTPPDLLRGMPVEPITVEVGPGQNEFETRTSPPAPAATQCIPQSSPQAPERVTEDAQRWPRMVAIARRIADLEDDNRRLRRNDAHATGFAEGRVAGIREALDELKGRGEYLIESKLRALLDKKPEVGT